MEKKTSRIEYKKMENITARNLLMGADLSKSGNISRQEIDESIRYQMWTGAVVELGECRTGRNQEFTRLRTQIKQLQEMAPKEAESESDTVVGWEPLGLSGKAPIDIEQNKE